MKGVVAAIAVILALLLAMPIAAAKDGELRKLNSTCDAEGNVEISMLHFGGAIKTTDIEITSVFIRTGSSKQVTGQWFQEGNANPLYLTEDYSSIIFRTNGSEFKKKGPYDVQFVFFQRKEDIEPTTVKTGFDCPGFPCSSDVDCDSDEHCSNSVCTALNCREGDVIEFHSCISRCNDFNPCTIDIYDNGTCNYLRKKGECCRNDADCDQGRACITDRCVNNACVEELVRCEAATDKCVYSFCKEPQGCVYETDVGCLASENEKREYLIVIGEPKVHKEPFWPKIFSAIGSFFRNLF